MTRLIVTLTVLASVIVVMQAKVEALDLQDCIQEALQHNPTMDLARARTEEAAAVADYSSRLLYPEVSLQASYFRLSDVDPFSVDTPLGTFQIADSILDSYSASLTIDQPVFTGFRLSNQAAMAWYLSQASNSAMANDATNLVYEVTRALFQIINGRETVRVIEETIAALEAHLQDVNNMHEAGVVTENDVLQSQVMVSNMRIQLAQANVGRDMAEVLMRTLLGRTDQQALDITWNAEQDLATIPSEDRLYDLACRARPDLQAMQSRQKADYHGIEMARSAYFPTVMARAAFTFANPNQRYQPPADEWNSDWQLGLALKYAPFSWGRNKQQIRKAKATYRQDEAQIQMILQKIKADLAEAWLRYEETSQRIALLDISRTHARENLRMAHDQYHEGISRNTDVLDAEINLLQVNLARIQAEIDHRVALAMIEKACGMSLGEMTRLMEANPGE